MNLQDIRKYYETPVMDCCTQEGVEYRPRTPLLPNGDAISTFCLARLQFGEMAESTIACGPVSNKRAVFIVEYYGPKGVGPRTLKTSWSAFLQIPRTEGRHQHQRPRLHRTRRPPLFLRAGQLRLADSHKIRLITQTVSVQT